LHKTTHLLIDSSFSAADISVTLPDGTFCSSQAKYSHNVTASLTWNMTNQSVQHHFFILNDYGVYEDVE